MALITAPSSFLSILTDSNVWLERRDFETRSLFTKKRQVLSYSSASCWMMSASLAPRNEFEAGEWRSFKMKLRGRENWFQCPMPQYYGPSTGYAGAIKVDGASQIGFALNLTGMTPSAAIFEAGDMFTVANQCFVVNADLTADGAGEGQVTFDTPLRTSPADLADLEIAAPYFLCASTNSNTANWRGLPGRRSEFSFEGAEHF